MWEEAKGEGRVGRFGLRTESKDRMRETLSDKGEAALVEPPLDLPWRRIVMWLKRCRSNYCGPGLWSDDVDEIRVELRGIFNTQWAVYRGVQ